MPRRPRVSRPIWQELRATAHELRAALAKMAKDFRWNAGQLPMSGDGIIDRAPVYYATILWNGLLESQAGRQQRRRSSCID